MSMKYVVFLFLVLLGDSSLHSLKTFEEIIRSIDRDEGDQKTWKHEILDSIYRELSGFSGREKNQDVKAQCATTVSKLVKHIYDLYSDNFTSHGEEKNKKLDRYFLLIKFLLKKSKNPLKIFEDKEKRLIRSLFCTSLAVAYCGCIELSFHHEAGHSFFLTMLKETIKEHCDFNLFKSLGHAYAFHAYQSSWNLINGRRREMLFDSYREQVKDNPKELINKMSNFLDSLRIKENWKK